MQPRRDYNEAWVYFFIVYMLFGAFFVMQIFVGVILDNFNRKREEAEAGDGSGGGIVMTEEQEAWAK